LQIERKERKEVTDSIRAGKGRLLRKKKAILTHGGAGLWGKKGRLSAETIAYSLRVNEWRKETVRCSASRHRKEGSWKGVK